MRGDAEMRIRLPEKEKEFIRQKAKESLRSQNSEVVLSIRERMGREAASVASARETTGQSA